MAYRTDEFTLQGCWLVIDVSEIGQAALAVHAPASHGRMFLDAYRYAPPEVLLQRLAVLLARGQSSVSGSMSTV